MSRGLRPATRPLRCGRAEPGCLQGVLASRWTISPSPSDSSRSCRRPSGKAAAIARALEGTVANQPKAASSDVKAALTIADTAAQEAILVPLLEAFPDVALEAEEDTETAALFGEGGGRLVVVDPIDGTLHSYLNARGPYATMVGFAVDGRYEGALVGLPREGIFLDAVRGGVARRARVRAAPKPWRAEPRGRRVLVHHAMPDAVCEQLRADGYDVVYGCGGAISVAPLLKGFCGGLRLAPGDREHPRSDRRPDRACGRSRGNPIARERRSRMISTRAVPAWSCPQAKNTTKHSCGHSPARTGYRPGCRVPNSAASPAHREARYIWVLSAPFAALGRRDSWPVAGAAAWLAYIWV